MEETRERVDAEVGNPRTGERRDEPLSAPRLLVYPHRPSAGKAGALGTIDSRTPDEDSTAAGKAASAAIDKTGEAMSITTRAPRASAPRAADRGKQKPVTLKPTSKPPPQPARKSASAPKQEPKPKPKPKPTPPAIAQHRFDARPDRLDLRDLPYRPPLASLPPVYPSAADVRRFLGGYVAEGLVLDQGVTGACTGFGLASVANYLLWVRHLEDRVRVPFLPASPRMLYELAKRYDEWPGVDYDGSSCRGALKGWHKHGVCSAPAWPYKLAKDGAAVFVRPSAGWELDAAKRPLGVYYRVERSSVVDLQAAIVNIGAVFVSATAHDGWDALFARKKSGAAGAAQPARRLAKPPTRHADLPSVAPIVEAASRGGHAFALVGYNERGFVVQNSWGQRWGASGFAVLPYEDWVVNGTDAWACALGVPRAVSRTQAQGGGTRPLQSTRWRVARGESLTDLQRSTREPRNPPDDPWPLDRPFLHRDYEPWSTDTAYAHTLVTGNDGELVATDFTRANDDRAGLAAEIVRELPLAWALARPEASVKLALYAHGGLNSEDASIKRIRMLGPCFEANGVYPLFLSWKTGAGETLASLAEDWVRKIVGDEAARSAGLLQSLGDAKDRAFETLARLFGRGVWSEMRENAERATRSGHGLELLLRHLLGLQADLAAAGKHLELHVAGHSAGAILLGHFLRLLAGVAAPAASPAPPGSGTHARAPQLGVETATLFAAACSVRFAKLHYLGAAQAGVLDLAKTWLYVLSDANEKADGLPSPQQPAYGKSLLYLVSRALDDVRKQPLLGMERAHDAHYLADDDQWHESELAALAHWQARWPPAAGLGLLRSVNTPEVRTSRADDRSAATHGSFDHNIEAIGETISRMSGRALVAPLEWLDY